MTRGVPLQLKLTVALVLIVMLPLAASTYFIGQLSSAAANVATGEASARVPVLQRAIDADHELVNEGKRLSGEIAARLAKHDDLLALDPTRNPALFVETFDIDIQPILDEIVVDPAQAGMRAIAILRPDGTVFADDERPPTGPGWRDYVVTQALGEAGSILRVVFEVRDVNADIEELNKQINATKTFVQIRSALPAGYRTAFMVLIGIAGLIAAVFGIWASTFVTRRIAALVSTARRVSEGQHDARVELRGNDEMAELGSAFNAMLDNLDDTRKQVAYLQRMGVWQDVARRLAHEIKNPLTPIQLAVQQCVSAYKGDDARFKQLLVDTGEIVEEEIEGLRRLVDTFRTLGALPKVEAAPVALADVLEELRLDPTVAERLQLVPPKEPVTVRADKLLLKRVLANLIENGIHAGEEAGTKGDVVVRWSAQGSVARILVDDHGGGVADLDRDRIFEPYVTTKQTGTGLGLAIARKIAIEHGGELAVAPERAPTGGARFVLTISAA
jgi:nitrogen fixation/metabolism regulation signal transduction histidine kinase